MIRCGSYLKTFLLSFALLPVASLAAGQPLDPITGETAAERDARMAWWREARFGMFIHWGLWWS